MQRVTACCSVLPCVAVCCSVLQCVAVCCSVLQCMSMRIGQITQDLRMRDVLSVTHGSGSYDTGAEETREDKRRDETKL